MKELEGNEENKPGERIEKAQKLLEFCMKSEKKITTRKTFWDKFGIHESSSVYTRASSEINLEEGLLRRCPVSRRSSGVVVGLSPNVLPEYCRVEN